MPSRLVADNLSRMNKDSYERIALHFSKTRKNSWADFSFFVPYLKNGMSILDLGCGNGRLLDFLNKHISSYKYCGLDVSDGLIKEAKRLFDNRFEKTKTEISFERADFLSDCWQNKDYDMIFMVASLNHIASKKDRDLIIKHVYDSLKPGGIVCMTNWNLWKPTLKRKSVYRALLTRFSIKMIKGLLLYGVNPFLLRFRDVITRWRFGKDSVSLYYHAFTKSEIKRLAIKNGFDIVMNRYSFDDFWKGGNIITVLRKP